MILVYQEHYGPSSSVVEQATENRRVGGSIPPSATISPKNQKSKLKKRFLVY